MTEVGLKGKRGAARCSSEIGDWEGNQKAVGGAENGFFPLLKNQKLLGKKFHRGHFHAIQSKAVSLYQKR